MSRLKPGMPIPGSEGVVRAADVAATLGLQPGTAPKEGVPAGLLTPNQARKLMSDEYPGESPDMGWETITIQGGRDAMNVLSVDPATLPVGVEAELGAPQPRPERRSGWRPDAASNTPSPPPAAATSAATDKLRADFHAHAAKITAMAEDARGDAVKEARAAEQVRLSAELGADLKARGIL